MKKIKSAAAAVKLAGIVTYCVVHPDNNKFAKYISNSDAR